MNLTRACLARWAEDPAWSGSPAFTFVAQDGRDRTWTYGETWPLVQRVGRGMLDLGLEPGDRVLMRLSHSPEFAFAFFGASLAGLLPIPASPMLTGEEAEFLVEDSEASGMVVEPGMELSGFGGVVITASELEGMDGVSGLPETQAEDPAYLIYTSGTTRRPKGVLHAHRSIRGRALMREGWQGFRPGDTTLHAGALNWSYTLGVGVMDPWAAGAHAVLAAAPQDPAAWPALMERLRVSVFTAVPTVYRQVLKHCRPRSSISRRSATYCAQASQCGRRCSRSGAGAGVRRCTSRWE